MKCTVRTAETATYIFIKKDETGLYQLAMPRISLVKKGKRKPQGGVPNWKM